MDSEIKFRVATESKALFEAAAERDGRKLSDWVRRACVEKVGQSWDKLSEKVLLDGTVQTLYGHEPEPDEAVTVRVLGDPKEVAGVDPARGEDRGATVRGKVEKGVLTVDSVETGDTRTPQERMDDFYRSNMSGKK